MSVAVRLELVSQERTEPEGRQATNSCCLFGTCVNCLLCHEALEEPAEMKQKNLKTEQGKKKKGGQKTSLVE